VDGLVDLVTKLGKETLIDALRFHLQLGLDALKAPAEIVSPEHWLIECIILVPIDLENLV
jgi:hypothetical protein